MGILKAFGLLAVVLIVTTGVASPDPASWSSFMDAAISGVTLDQPLATNVLEYTLTVGPAPKLIFGGNTYDIVWVQAWYVVSLTGAEDFIAEPGYAPPDWKWESKTIPGRIVGWQGQGNERVYPGQSKFFTFTSFDITNMPVVAGYHLGYTNPGGGTVYTAWFKDTQIPEPGTLIGLASMALGAVFGFRRRR
jgi:hypothetical protein